MRRSAPSPKQILTHAYLAWENQTSVKHHGYSLDLKKAPLTGYGNKVRSNNKCFGVAVLTVNKRPQDGADTTWRVRSFSSAQLLEQEFPKCSRRRQAKKKSSTEWLSVTDRQPGSRQRCSLPMLRKMGQQETYPFQVPYTNLKNHIRIWR